MNHNNTLALQLFEINIPRKQHQPTNNTELILKEVMIPVHRGCISTGISTTMWSVSQARRSTCFWIITRTAVLFVSRSPQACVCCLCVSRSSHQPLRSKTARTKMPLSYSKVHRKLLSEFQHRRLWRFLNGLSVI